MTRLLATAVSGMGHVKGFVSTAWPPCCLPPAPSAQVSGERERGEAGGPEGGPGEGPAVARQGDRQALGGQARGHGRAREVQPGLRRTEEPVGDRATWRPTGIHEEIQSLLKDAEEAEAGRRGRENPIPLPGPAVAGQDFRNVHPRWRNPFPPGSPNGCSGSTRCSRPRTPSATPPPKSWADVAGFYASELAPDPGDLPGEARIPPRRQAAGRRRACCAWAWSPPPIGTTRPAPWDCWSRPGRRVDPVRMARKPSRRSHRGPLRQHGQTRKGRRRLRGHAPSISSRTRPRARPTW